MQVFPTAESPINSNLKRWSYAFFAIESLWNKEMILIGNMLKYVHFIAEFSLKKQSLHDQGSIMSAAMGVIAGSLAGLGAYQGSQYSTPLGIWLF